MSYTPCQTLWSDVLASASKDAINSGNNCCEYVKAQKKRLKIVAVGWLHSKKEDIGSFLWVCEALDLLPEPTRKAALAGEIKFSWEIEYEITGDKRQDRLNYMLAYRQKHKEIWGVSI